MGGTGVKGGIHIEKEREIGSVAEMHQHRGRRSIEMDNNITLYIFNKNK